MNAVPTTVGIDLGTTNTVVARVNGAHHTEVVRTQENELLLPSIVLFDDARVAVGEEARLRGRRHPQRVVSCVKRCLGENSQLRAVDGAAIPPEVVQSMILNRVRENVTRRTGGNELAAAIAVPAFFGEPQRKATADAGRMAGIHVLDVVNEPVATALAYSEHTDYLSPASPSDTSRLLVFDLGGFSFEVSLLEARAGNLKMLATAHDLHLGGHDWEFRLADDLAQKFQRRHGCDPRKDPSSLEQLLLRAERAKRTLGLRRSALVTVEHAGQQLTVPVTRDHFLQLTSDVLERAAEMTGRLISQLDMDWSDVSRVLLVGGATRMPQIRHMLFRLTGKAPDASVNPDEAVARGAAIYAHQLQAMSGALGRTPRFRVTNVTTHGLGLEGVDPKSGRKVNKTLIPKGTALPARATRKFVTRAGDQRSITVVVLEGESSDPNRCTRIGQATIHDLPADLGEEWPIDVTYEYSIGGRLKVDVKVRYTDRDVHLEMMRTTGLSARQVQDWRQLVMSRAGLRQIRRLLETETHPPIALASSDRPLPDADADADADAEAPSLSVLASRYAGHVLQLLGMDGNRERDEQHV